MGPVGSLTNNRTVYGDSTPSMVILVEEGTTLADLAPVDLRLHTVAAHVDDVNGTKVTEWTPSYGDQDDPDLRGRLVLDLGPVAIGLLQDNPADLFAYDVKVTRTADGHSWYPVQRSTLTLCAAVTDG